MTYAKQGMVLGLLLAAMMPIKSSAEAETKQLSMQALLERVKEGRSQAAALHRQREAEFIADQARQEAFIEEALMEIQDLEEQSGVLEKEFGTNALLIEEKRKQRKMRLGSLQELFGHLTGVAGDLRSHFRNSLTTSQFPNREEFLDDLIRKMNSDTELPTIEEIERVWYELHREMTESGRVVKYTTTVGTEAQREVVRIGLFNLVSAGDYLAYDADTQKVSVLPRQPAGLAAGARTLQAATDGSVAVGIDPTGAAGGGLLKAIIDTPTWRERWRQGRYVGYVITGIGCIALLIALWRCYVLGLISAKMNRQLQRREILADNPLGRVLKVAEAHKYDDPESLELTLGAAILQEGPAIQAGLAMLKIIAMVAPLLGLLGTVAGMIVVFQAITIYGAGDPKAMAGGISAALVTTVLGLVVAIPTLLLHTLLNDKAKKIRHTLEAQSAGIVAERAGH